VNRNAQQSGSAHDPTELLCSDQLSKETRYQKRGHVRDDKIGGTMIVESDEGDAIVTRQQPHGVMHVGMLISTGCCF
jgi:hypothetical protein